MPGRETANCSCGQCRRYKELKRDFKEKSRRAGAACWICRQAIDYSLPPDHVDAFNLDHRLPRADFPELTEVPSNFRPSHGSCNKARGRREPVSLGTTTRDW